MALLNDPIDLKVDESGELTVSGGQLQLSSGVDAVAQGIRLRIKAFRGEWFLDLQDGVPYFQSILGKKFDAASIREEFRRAIVAAPGVVELISLGVTFDGATRAAAVSWEVRTEFGDTVADTLSLEM